MSQSTAQPAAATPDFDTLHRSAIREAQSGRMSAAEQLLHEALRVNPGSAEAHSNLGLVRHALGRIDEALASYQHAVALNPACLPAHNGRGRVLMQMRRFEEALASFEQAIALKPDYIEALSNRGGLLYLLERDDAAIASYERALAALPDYVPALIGLGQVLYRVRRFAAAVEACDRALAIAPDTPQLLSLLGQCLTELGRIEEAVACFEKALALPRADHHIAAHYIFTLDLAPGRGFAEHQHARRLWWQKFSAGAAIVPATRHANSGDPDRRLSVGYVSGDFNMHSAAFVFGPVLRHHDKSQVEIVCYSNSTVNDKMTEQFRHIASRWRDVAHLTDEALAAQIAADRIDILVDLSGHSRGSRLGAFARKPAPVQVSAWGHATGTGVPAMDYVFSDPVLIPAEARPLFAERIFDLPCAQAMTPPDETPPVTDPPLLANGYITYGVFNRIAKISPEALAVWARILAADPNARLVVKHQLLDDAAVREAFCGRVAAAGITPDRVALKGASPRFEHLRAMNDIDVFLDPFPQNGGVSTCEPLAMGVPVVARLGNGVPSRISAAILSSLGLDDWIAETDDDYVRIAAGFAAAPDLLKELRHSLPARVAASPAGNAAAYTKTVEAAYRTMWRDYCRQQR